MSQAKLNTTKLPKLENDPSARRMTPLRETNPHSAKNYQVFKKHENKVLKELNRPYRETAPQTWEVEQFQPEYHNKSYHTQAIPTKKHPKNMLPPNIEIEEQLRKIKQSVGFDETDNITDVSEDSKNPLKSRAHMYRTLGLSHEGRD